jgi:predicted phosphoribosyltransferase
MSNRERLNAALKRLQKEPATVLVIEEPVYANAFRKDFPSVADKVLCTSDPDYAQTSKGKTLIKDDFLHG